MAIRLGLTLLANILKLIGLNRVCVLLSLEYQCSVTTIDPQRYYFRTLVTGFNTVGYYLTQHVQLVLIGLGLITGYSIYRSIVRLTVDQPITVGDRVAGFFSGSIGGLGGVQLWSWLTGQPVELILNVKHWLQVVYPDSLEVKLARAELAYRSVRLSSEHAQAVNQAQFSAWIDKGWLDYQTRLTAEYLKSMPTAHLTQAAQDHARATVGHQMSDFLLHQPGFWSQYGTTIGMAVLSVAIIGGCVVYFWGGTDDDQPPVLSSKSFSRVPGSSARYLDGRIEQVSQTTVKHTQQINYLYKQSVANTTNLENLKNYVHRDIGRSVLEVMGRR